VEKPINQRLKFLLTSLDMSARDFSRAVEVPDNNTQNYLEPRFAQPKADYLEKVVLHFKSVNPAWLLAGQGEPFLPDAQGSITQTGKFNQAGTRNKQTVTSNKVGYQTNTGAAQETQSSAALESANKEIALLREQLAMKDQLIAAKEEMLSLLRGGYNRPN